MSSSFIAGSKTTRPALWFGLLLGLVGLGMLGGCCTVGFGPCTLSDKFTLTGAKSLNSCSDDGRSHPVAVRIFPLKDPAKFQAAGFDEIWDNASETLGGDLSGEVTKVFVQPESSETVAIIREDGVTAYGVLANFCERNEESFSRKIYTIGKRGTKQSVNLSGKRMTSD